MGDVGPIPLILSAIAVLSNIASVGWMLWKDNKSTIASSAVADAVSKATGAGMDILTVRVSSLELRCTDLRVEIAEKYVSRAMLETTETRLLHALAGVQAAVEAMTSRLDRAFERPLPNTVQHR